MLADNSIEKELVKSEMCLLISTKVALYASTFKWYKVTYMSLVSTNSSVPIPSPYSVPIDLHTKIKGSLGPDARQL